MDIAAEDAGTSVKSTEVPGAPAYIEQRLYAARERVPAPPASLRRREERRVPANATRASTSTQADPRAGTSARWQIGRLDLPHPCNRAELLLPAGGGVDTRCQHQLPV